MPNLPPNNFNNELVISEHFNEAQLLIMLINANFTNGIWGRGTGKTTGAEAWRTVHCAKVMPRSAGTFSSPSYRKFTDHIWPALRKGYQEKFHFVEDRDFCFLKPPPQSWRLENGQWAVPYMAPGYFHHFISFPNGSGYHVISQDHGQTANALDTDWSIVEEAKLQNGERIQEELWNTLRGNKDRFGHLPEHYSRWVFSDKYTRSDSKQTRWFEEYKDQSLTAAQMKEILVLVYTISICKNKKLRDHLTKQLHSLQKQAVFYSEASAVDNLAVLGIDFIRNQSKSSTPYGLLTSIFNMEVKKVEGDLFYPLLSEYIHGYDASDNSRIDSIIERSGFDSYLEGRDYRLDTDVMDDVALKVCLDFGGTFNWAVVCQLQINVIKALKNFWVEKPKKFPDLIREICRYYKHRLNRKIELYYDVGANKEDNRTIETDAQVVIEVFQKEGWIVTVQTTTKTYIPHKLKYRFWEHCLDRKSNRDDRFPKFAYNRANCLELGWSMSHAKLVKTSREQRKYEKDKRSEGDAKLPQWQATHLSDCIDWLAIDYLHILDERKKKRFIALGGN